MSKRIDYKTGETVGSSGLVYVEEREKRGIHRVALFRCVCGEEFETRVGHVKNGNTKSCGCHHLGAVTTHGLSSHSLYQTWNGIKTRCYNPKDKAYKNYGGRGIKVQENWVEDPQSFFDYVTNLPHYREKGRTLDRIDNKDGNYVEGHLRWATPRQQSINQRLAKDNKTGYRGVCFDKSSGKYKAYYQLNGKRKTKSTFTTALDAYKWRISQIKLHNLVDYEEYHFTEDYINNLT